MAASSSTAPMAPPALRKGSVPLQRLVDFFQTLRPDSLPQIARIYAPQARFRDPFNDVQGVPAIEAIFVDMFRRTRDPHFVVTGTVEQGDDAFVTWDFLFHTGSRPMRVQGCSQLHFDAQGQVDVHRDYWDAAGELYEQLPLLGVLMRALRRKLAAH